MVTLIRPIVYLSSLTSYSRDIHERANLAGVMRPPMLFQKSSRQPTPNHIGCFLPVLFPLQIAGLSTQGVFVLFKLFNIKGVHLHGPLKACYSNEALKRDRSQSQMLAFSCSYFSHWWPAVSISSHFTHPYHALS